MQVAGRGEVVLPGVIRVCVEDDIDGRQSFIFTIVAEACHGSIHPRITTRVRIAVDSVDHESLGKVVIEVLREVEFSVERVHCDELLV